jgi:hypothetical protein
MRGATAILLGAMISACLVGCSDSASAIEDELVGVWYSKLYIYVAFDADGTYGKGHSAEQAQGQSQNPVMDWGTWSVEDDVLTLITADGSEYCGDTTATYRVAIADDGSEVRVTLLDDPCGIRSSDLTNGLTRRV